jgi:PleD family two-component response regulator
MANLETTNIYLAIRNDDERSHIEDQLVLDGADVSSFTSANDLWTHFQANPARFVITDRLFGRGFDGMELVRKIRSKYQLPYVYVLIRSRLAQLKEIKEGLAVGVDDYLVYPHNNFQIRSRVLVGMRWLTYIDSITNNKPESRFPLQAVVSEQSQKGNAVGQKQSSKSSNSNRMPCCLKLNRI